MIALAGKWVEIINDNYFFYAEDRRIIYKISSNDASIQPMAVAKKEIPKHLLKKEENSFRKSKLDSNSILILGNEDDSIQQRVLVEKHSFTKFNTSTLRSQKINSR